jgi:hypothetical protein
MGIFADVWPFPAFASLNDHSNRVYVEGRAQMGMGEGGNDNIVKTLCSHITVQRKRNGSRESYSLPLVSILLHRHRLSSFYFYFIFCQDKSDFNSCFHPGGLSNVSLQTISLSRLRRSTTSLYYCSYFIRAIQIFYHLLFRFCSWWTKTLTFRRTVLFFLRSQNQKRKCV